MCEQRGKEIEDDRVRLENQVYAAIFPTFAKYESRGQNAHRAAQSLLGVVSTAFLDRLGMQERRDHFLHVMKTGTYEYPFEKRVALAEECAKSATNRVLGLYKAKGESNEKSPNDL